MSRGKTGELDRRLTDGRRVTAAEVEAVLADHQAEASVRSAQKARCDVQACAACGYRPTRQQPVCRSVAVAQGIRWGRTPQWHGPIEEHGHEQERAVEQRELFDVERSA